MNWSLEEDGYDWAIEFDMWTRDAIANEPQLLVNASAHEHYQKAVPTLEHFIPALYIAGLADATSQTEVITGGCAYGSISMTSWSVN